jgi:osmotically-inducible protein OsmY
MNKKTWKHLIGLALPLALAAGCAHDRHDRYATVASSPGGTTTLTPTSESTAERVYSGDPSPIGQYAPPPGASANDWSLAEEVRSLLTSDKKLVREPMSAAVDKGLVTLRGYVNDKSDGEKIERAVASLPGVTHVDNQLVVQHILTDIPGKSKEY